MFSEALKKYLLKLVKYRSASNAAIQSLPATLVILPSHFANVPVEMTIVLSSMTTWCGRHEKPTLLVLQVIHHIGFFDAFAR